jgi:hypothetical protein
MIGTTRIGGIMARKTDAATAMTESNISVMTGLRHCSARRRHLPAARQSPGR